MTKSTPLFSDISVIHDMGKLDDRGCRGAPDWVLEILSSSSATKDHLQKREIYQRAGVKEYWLVHPTEMPPCTTDFLRLQDDKRFNAEPGQRMR